MTPSEAHSNARHSTVRLAGERLSLVVAPGLGAKVVSLLDRTTGREWLTQGRPPENADAPDAVFDGAAAYGWDECLPSVAPAPDPLDAARMLRDHGDLWGRPTETGADEGTIETIGSGLAWSYEFSRRLSIAGSTVHADYLLSSRDDRPLPFLWSMHPLFALDPGSRIHVPNGGRMRLSHGSGLGLEAGSDVVWPASPAADGRFVGLDIVRGIEAGQAAKLYAGPLASGRAAIEAPDGSWLGLEWDLGFAPYLGLWLDYGGWPAAPKLPLHQVALEPTTAPADDLPGALSEGQAITLHPGERVAWWVRLVLGAPGGEALEPFLEAST